MNPDLGPRTLRIWREWRKVEGVRWIRGFTVFYIIVLSGRGQFSSVSSVAQSCPTLCDPMNCSTSGLPVHYQLPEFIQTHVYWVGDAIQLPHPLWSPSPPAFNHSQHQGLFQWLSSSHQVAKYWSFSFSLSPSNEYSGLVSFRMDWLDLLTVQGTLKSLQHHSLKASILQCSIFFMVQLSHPYMTTGMIPSIHDYLKWLLLL